MALLQATEDNAMMERLAHDAFLLISLGGLGIFLLQLGRACRVAEVAKMSNRDHRHDEIE